jgi:hypothetical protein
MNSYDDDYGEHVDAIAAKIKTILAGNPPVEQGAALAVCLASWLVGHYSHNENASTKLRADLLANHMQLVIGLISDFCEDSNGRFDH